MARKAKKRKKSAVGPLTRFWVGISELAPAFLEKPQAKRKKISGAISDFLEEVNASPLPGMISENFVKPYFPEKPIDVKFSPDEKGNYGKWPAKLAGEISSLKIDPVGIYRFSMNLKNSGSKSREAARKEEEAFALQRKTSFYREVAKLPEQYLLFIAVLQEISLATQVFAVDSRKEVGLDNAESVSYYPLLWALKQFEEFYQKVQNRSLRSDFGIIWHEGEWVEEK